MSTQRSYSRHIVQNAINSFLTGTWKASALIVKNLQGVMSVTRVAENTLNQGKYWSRHVKSVQPGEYREQEHFLQASGFSPGQECLGVERMKMPLIMHLAG